MQITVIIIAKALLIDICVDREMLSAQGRTNPHEKEEGVLVRGARVVHLSTDFMFFYLVKG